MFSLSKVKKLAFKFEKIRIRKIKIKRNCFLKLKPIPWFLF